MFIKVVTVGATIGGNEEDDAYVNFALVRSLTKDKRTKGTKIVYMDGTTISVNESPDKIMAILNGKIETAYRAPDHK